jgi:hypothetical protein
MKGNVMEKHRPIPGRDTLRVDAQRPVAGQTPSPTGVKVEPVDELSSPPGQSVATGTTTTTPTGTATLLPYPFTKGISLRNDALAYGEDLVEQYACYVRGKLHPAQEARSHRTRTARTFPNIAPPVDFGTLPKRDSVPPSDPPMPDASTEQVLGMLSRVASASKKDDKP